METLARSSLIDLGSTDDQLRASVQDGALQRVRRGHYAQVESWRSAYVEERQRALAQAATRSARTPPVMCRATAAAMHGLPLFRLEDERVHVLAGHGGSGTQSDAVIRHREHTDGSFVVCDGVRVTPLVRTVFDVARTARPETALACADAALRRVSRPQRTRQVDEAASREFCEQFRQVIAEHPGARGVKQARRIGELMDPRADSPGESVSRLYLVQLRVRAFAVQRPVMVASGRTYWVDFEIQGVFGEYDGAVKYRDREMRGNREPEQVVFEEKVREDEIRAATSRRFIRWTSSEIRSLATYARFLTDNGIRVPASA